MKNLAYLTIVALVALVGSYLWLQLDKSKQVEVSPTTNESSADGEVVVSEDIPDEVPSAENLEAPVSDSPELEPVIIDYTGTHIMPDGSVMTGRGLILTDAVVTAEGMIKLKDGTMLTPTADMRPKTE